MAFASAQSFEALKGFGSVYGGVIVTGRAGPGGRASVRLVIFVPQFLLSVPPLLLLLSPVVLFYGIF